MNIDKMMEGFESANSHRAWFVSGGRIDTGPEGFVYDDFVTDMCWTCWAGSRAAIEVELPDRDPHDLSISAMFGYQEARKDAIKAIESLGLKVKS